MNETNRSGSSASSQTAQEGKRLGTAATAAASAMLALGISGCVGKDEHQSKPAPGQSNATLVASSAPDRTEFTDGTQKIFVGTLAMTNTGTEGAVLYSGGFVITNASFSQTGNEWTALEVRNQAGATLFNINKESTAFTLINTGAPSDKLLPFNTGNNNYYLYAMPQSQGAVVGQIWKARLGAAKFSGTSTRSDLISRQLNGLTDSGNGTFRFDCENVTVSAPPAGVGAVDNVRDGVLLAMFDKGTLGFETKIKPLNLN